MTDRNARLAGHKMSLWKAIPLSFLAFLPFSAFLLIIPPYFSRSAFVTAGVLIALGIVLSNWGRFGSPRFSDVSASFVLVLEILTIGIRAWMAAFPDAWGGIVVIAALYLAVWILPLVAPNLSSFLWRELMAPETPMGRKLLALVISIGPTAGVIGASAGMFGSRSGANTWLWLATSLLASLIALGWGLATAHQAFIKYGGGETA